MKVDIEMKLRQTFALEDPEIADFIETFMRGFGESCEVLRPLRETCDEMPLRESTHKIIGYASSVGASDLCGLATNLNQAARNHDRAEIGRWIDEIFALHSRYEAE